MNKLFSLFAALSLAIMAFSQSPKDACTSIMAGRLATVDGSVITSHTCDSWYRSWISVEPARDFPNDTVMDIFEGLMHTEKPGDMTGVKIKGQIPQARHTFQFVNTAYPCLNEHQLAIGETTTVGRDSLLRNRNGLFMIEELERIALQRCSTARDAIRLIGELVKKYGYGDSGECLTIADPQEVWIFEIFGEGPKRIGGVWAAQRIPDDHIAVSANIARIGKINLNDPDHFIASDNVFDVARRLGLWDGKSDFSFWKAYGGPNYFKELKNYSVRELFIMQQLAPSAGFNKDMEELPVSVKPDHKISVAEVSRLLGSYYEGTNLNLSGRLKIAQKGDSVVSPVANPWMRPDEINLYYALGDSVMKNIRTVSVSWCAYSTVIQLRSWLPDAVGGVAWIALDCPGESPRFPVFAGTTKLPDLLSRCGQHSDRDDAALTHFRHANRMATVRWGKTRQYIEDAQKYFADKAAREQQFVIDTYNALSDDDSRTTFLNGYTADFFAAEILRYDELSHRFWRMFWSGF